MKILQVLPYFKPAYSFGGPIKLVDQLSTELTRRGHEVVIYTSDARDKNSRLHTCEINAMGLQEGIKTYYFKNVSMIFVNKFNFFIVPELNSRIKKEIQNFDIVHLHDFRTYHNLVCYYYAKKYNIPYVVQAHGSIPRYGKKILKMFYDKLFSYRLLQNSSKIVVLNSMEYKQCIEMGLSRDKIVIIPNGINKTEYDNIDLKGYFRNKFGIGHDDKIILFVGRLHESKGLDYLIKSYSIVSDHFINSKLVIVGPDDGFASNIHHLIQQFNLTDKVILTSFLPNKDKMSAFVDSDVFVTPIFYGFPITFLESCLAGCPIVTTSKDLDWIHNNVGLVTNKSIKSLAYGILLILNNEDLRNKFSVNCINIANKYDIKNIVNMFENLYRIILNK